MMRAGGVFALPTPARVRVVLLAHEAVPQMSGGNRREAAPERRESRGIGSDSARCASAARCSDNSLECRRRQRKCGL